MKPGDFKSDAYIEYGVEPNGKDPKSKLNIENIKK